MVIHPHQWESKHDGYISIPMEMGGMTNLPFPGQQTMFWPWHMSLHNYFVWGKLKVMKQIQLKSVFLYDVQTCSICSTCFHKNRIFSPPNMTATSHLVAHPTNRKWVITCYNPASKWDKGNVHSKNWGELTHLRFVGSSPPNSQVAAPAPPAPHESPRCSSPRPGTFVRGSARRRPRGWSRATCGGSFLRRPKGQFLGFFFAWFHGDFLWDFMGFPWEFHDDFHGVEWDFLC